MYDNKNNKNNIQSNQIDVIQDVTTRCSRGKKVEKLQPKLYKEDLGFTQLLNETLNAIDDAEMLGVYCYLASKPEEWEISKQQLRNHFKIGVNKIDNIFTKLKSFGLLETLPVKNKQGQIIHWDYYLKMRISIPMETIPMESTTMETMPLENTPPINKEYINKEKEIYKEKEKQPQANKSPIIQFLFSNNPFNFDEETLKGYLEMRKSIKKPLTEKAWILLIKEIQKAVDQGIDPFDCINEAILRSWQGFKCEWLQRHSEAKIMQPRAPEGHYNRKETASTVPFYNSTEKNDKPRTDEQVKSALQATKNMLSKLKKNVP